LGGSIKGSGRDSGGFGGTVTSGRDSSGVGGGIEGFGRDSGGGIVASGRDSGGRVASGRDSTGLRGGIEGFGRVGAFVGSGTRLLACILGSNGCKAFLLDLSVLDLAVLARHVLQVARTLPPGLEASLRNIESGSFLIQAEQYLESISDIKTNEWYTYKCIRVWEAEMGMWKLAKGSRYCTF
jgi:hypothetical protein